MSCIIYLVITVNYVKDNSQERYGNKSTLNFTNLKIMD